MANDDKRPDNERQTRTVRSPTRSHHRHSLYKSSTLQQPQPWAWGGIPPRVLKIMQLLLVIFAALFAASPVLSREWMAKFSMDVFSRKAALPDLYEASVLELQAGLGSGAFSSVDLVKVRLAFVSCGVVLCQAHRFMSENSHRLISRESTRLTSKGQRFEPSSRRTHRRYNKLGSWT